MLKVFSFLLVLSLLFVNYGSAFAQSNPPVDPGGNNKGNNVDYCESSVKRWNFLENFTLFPGDYHLSAVHFSNNTNRQCYFSYTIRAKYQMTPMAVGPNPITLPVPCNNYESEKMLTITCTGTLLNGQTVDLYPRQFFDGSTIVNIVEDWTNGEYYSWYMLYYGSFVPLINK